MNYDLAKQLKDAGFPQEIFNLSYSGDNERLCNFAYEEGIDDELHLIHVDNDEGGIVGNDYLHREKDDIKWVKFLTLSELIEACDKLHGLYRDKDCWVAWTRKRLSKGEIKTDIECFGKTPEEAVAKLWLELNKKI